MDELVAIQQTDTGVPFQMNERNARELVKLLVDKGKLDGVFTQSGDFLMTVRVYMVAYCCTLCISKCCALFYRTS